LPNVEGQIGQEQPVTPPVQTLHKATKPSRSQAARGKIVVLMGTGPLPWIMINSLTEKFGPVTVLEEDHESKKLFLKRRIKMLGPITVAGQVAFGVLLKFMHKRSAARKESIMKCQNLSSSRPVNCEHHHIGNINSEACRRKLKEINPDAVVVIGTRMIRKKTLQCVPAPFINYHAGLNPKYRGMNGGYWAHATGDIENAGVTVHLVDSGVDTGGALYNASFKAGPRDNFVTYPYLQAAAARPLLNSAVEDALKGDKFAFDNRDLPSKQWFHPTIWQYLWTGVTRHVW